MPTHMNARVVVLIGATSSSTHCFPRLAQVSVKAEEMRSQADVFRKTARETKLHFCWQHYKMILLLVVILIVIGVVIWFVII